MAAVEIGCGDAGCASGEGGDLGTGMMLLGRREAGLVGGGNGAAENVELAVAADLKVAADGFLCGQNALLSRCHVAWQPIGRPQGRRRNVWSRNLDC